MRLADSADQSDPTVFLPETETIVSPKKIEQVIPLDSIPSQNRQPPFNQTYPVPAPPPPPEIPKSNTAFIVGMTVLAMLGIFGLGVGGWFLLKNRQTETSRTENRANTANRRAAVNDALNTNETVTPTPTATPTPTPMPTATPTPDFNPEQIRKDVSEVVQSWKSLTESRNINGYMSLYAPTVDYYNTKGASINSVRADKQNAFRRYDQIEINISNLRVTPDDSGRQATAVFDKEWVFDGEEYSSGKVQSQLQFREVNGRWLITSERDLRVYHIDR
jgi:hypothetical protein